MHGNGRVVCRCSHLDTGTSALFHCVHEMLTVHPTAEPDTAAQLRFMPGLMDLLLQLRAELQQVR